MKNLHTFSIFLFFINFIALSQEHLSGFTSISLTYKPHKNWYGYLETQGRSISDFNKIDYYEIKRLFTNILHNK